MSNHLEDLGSVWLIRDRVAQTLSSFNHKEKEVRFVALKSITHLAEAHPNIFKKYLQFFFCSYQDPFFIKEEKLKILTALADEDTID